MTETETLNETHHWVSETYELIQIMPAQGFQAVWAVGLSDEEAPLQLFSEPVDALGLAKVTTSYLEESPGTSVRKRYPDETHNRVVGLRLEGGYWHIVDEDCNFAGLCRDGEDLRTATGCLSAELFQRVTKWGYAKQTQNGDYDE